MILDLRKTYLRWRHSKGFGVHSPYAYRFVMDVLRPGPYRFYSYHEVESLLKPGERHDYRFERLLRFTIRLCNFLKTKRILCVPDSRVGAIVADAMRLERLSVNQSAEIEFKDGDLLIIEKSELSENIVKSAIKNKVPVFALNPGNEIRELLETPIERGLLLKGKKRIILIPRQEMAFIAYDIFLDLRSGLGE